ncbi:MAG TPA: 1,4-dihydroxy-6-naphthoate synthase [Bacteroidia bacterium]|nr:1,4-dihydroxy-6-naphthoate synthase [Bacteroidia bacterium]
MNRKITIGFSPCPNDTFMFCALVNGMIDCEGLNFEPVIDDVETLNQKALRGELDVTKLSVSAFAQASKNYLVLNSGSALGKNCGPLLISKRNYSVHDIDNLKIAIPGKYTTANLLLSIFFPDAKNKTEMIFSEIENAVMNESVDAGLIIHENRFTYQQKGLKKIADMGELWEQNTNALLPLGCIAIKKDISAVLQNKIDGLVNKSTSFAFQYPGKVMDYVRSHSQEMDDKVMQQHIDLYVNEFSLALGSEGKKAIELLFKKGNAAKLLPEISGQIFVS